MTEPQRVIVAGHICLDIIPNVSAIAPGVFNAMFRPGHLLEAGQATLATGGPVSNTGLALHRLGVPVCLIGKVGHDPFGQVVLNLINAYGPNLAQGMAIDSQVTTSYSIIISPPHTDRIFLHCPGANHDFCAADVSDAELAQADLLHFGYPPVMRRMYTHDGHELAELMSRAKSIGVTTSLDLCYPDPLSEAGQADWSAIFRSVLPQVDLFLPSVEELLFMLRRETLNELTTRGNVVDQITPDLLTSVSDELLRLGTKVVMIKMGDRGAYLRTAGEATLMEMGRARPRDLALWADQEMWAPCCQVEVVGTTGSGDATIAGFLSALLRDASPQQALMMAVAVGACNVEAADAVSGIRTWEATTQRLANGWPRLPLSLNALDWAWDSKSNLWQRVI